MSEANAYFVAVIGAGPSGLFGARELANQGARVVIFNRDIKPGGLAEYGVYPDKHKMKEGFRKQFRQALANENITYYSNIKMGAQGDLTLDDLRALGFQAILVTVGAQSTKWLGPGWRLSFQACRFSIQQAPALRPAEIQFGPTLRNHRRRQCDAGYCILHDPRSGV